MLTGAIFLLAVQTKKAPAHHARQTDLAQFFAEQWWGAEMPPNEMRQVIMSPAHVLDFATPDEVRSSKGTTVEPDDLAKAFRPFWIAGKPRDNQYAVFERRVTFQGEVKHCSVILSADDDYTMTVNGQHLADGANTAFQSCEFDASALIRQNTSNMFYLAVHNETGPGFARVRIQADVALPVRGEPTSWRCREVGRKSWHDAKIVVSPTFDREKGESIWTNTLGNGVQAVEFQRFIKMTGIPTKASILVGADNAWELWVNGTEVGRQGISANVAPAKEIDISKLFKRGTNVITAKVWNYGGPASFFCVPSIQFSI